MVTLTLEQGMGLVALMGAAATIAGAAEDLESDVGSQSNPNSQVQLAPQMNYLHRIFNKAISGEPPAYGFWCATGATAAAVFMSAGFSVIFSIAVGSLIGSLVHGIYATTPFLGRPASQKRYGQPVYLDVLRGHIVPIMAHSYIAVVCIVGLSWIMNAILGHPFPLPLLALIWGITVGAIGSSTGDVHYGAEREFQNFPFGAGLNAADSGNIVRKAEAGLRNSIDNAWFCAKFGGPLTGIAFGMTVFLDNWRTTIFNPDTFPQNPQLGLWLSIIAGVIIVIILNLWNWRLEMFARSTYGPYKEEMEVAA